MPRGAPSLLPPRLPPSADRPGPGGPGRLTR